MKYYVYILYSRECNTYYKGFTNDVERRLFEHNNGLSRFTKGKGPWELVFIKEFSKKKEALVFERKVKRYNRNYLASLIKTAKDTV